MQQLTNADIAEILTFILLGAIRATLHKTSETATERERFSVIRGGAGDYLINLNARLSVRRGRTVDSPGAELLRYERVPHPGMCQQAASNDFIDTYAELLGLDLDELDEDVRVLERAARNSVVAAVNARGDRSRFTLPDVRNENWGEFWEPIREQIGWLRLVKLFFGCAGIIAVSIVEEARQLPG